MVLPKFEGKPLIELPKIIPVANLLTGDFGEAALQEYQCRARDYQGNRVLNVLSYQDGVVKGSNPPAVVLINQVLQEEGISVARLSDLGRILRTGALGLKGTYEDAALVLRSTNDPNHYLAENLQEQLRARGKIKYPTLVNLADLELANDSESPYGLSFRLKEGVEIVHAEKLDHRNKGRRFSETDENGLPIFSDDGSRRLYTRDSGLSRVCLSGFLNLSSDWDFLDFSVSYGRVVAVRGEAAAQDLEAQINARRDAKLEEVKQTIQEH